MVQEFIEETCFSEWNNFLALATIPLEGILFFGTIYGYANFAEILKNQGVFENVCNENEIETSFQNGTINCPARDTLFTFVLQSYFKNFIFNINF